jgi:hypothetical protein
LLPGLICSLSIVKLFHWCIPVAPGVFFPNIHPFGVPLTTLPLPLPWWPWPFHDAGMAWRVIPLLVAANFFGTSHHPGSIASAVRGAFSVLWKFPLWAIL